MTDHVNLPVVQDAPTHRPATDSGRLMTGHVNSRAALAVRMRWLATTTPVPPVMMVPVSSWMSVVFAEATTALAVAAPTRMQRITIPQPSLMTGHVHSDQGV